MYYLFLYQRKPEIIARAGVGPNAGHSVECNGEKYGLRLTPSGFFNTDSRLLIGAGVLVNPDVFKHELEYLNKYNVDGRTFIDANCAIITEKHTQADKASSYLSEKIGTTGSGCGPANADRINRTIDYAKDIEGLEEYITDVPSEVNKALDEGKDVFIEGSQGFGLSLYYGTYPFVTSKDTCASTAAADVGVGPTRIDEVVVIFKAYTTRVGEGPFPTEITPEEAEKMGIEEYGVVTGRKRRVGLFDKEFAKRSCMINGATQVALTCIDRLYPECYQANKYEDLSQEAREYIEDIEESIGVPITIISTGPDLADTIDLRDEKLN
jgi:adenylosuccinate synthase